MTRHRTPRATWPIFFGLVGLFVCSVATPRGWETIARSHSLRTLTTSSDSASPHRSPVPAVESAPPPPAITLPSSTNASTRIPAPALLASFSKRSSHVEVREPLEHTLALAPAEAFEPAASETTAVPLPAATATLRDHIAADDMIAAPPRLRWWPVPEQLLSELAQLAAHPECRIWAEQVRRAVVELIELDGPAPQRANEILNLLEDLAAEQTTLQPLVPEGPRAVAFRRAGLSLVRRLDVWTRLPQVHELSERERLEAAPSPLRLANCLRDVEATVRAAEANSPWRDYLMLPELHLLARQGGELSADERARLAAHVLRRLEQAGIGLRGSMPQPAALAKLHAELRRWAVLPVDARQMLVDMEQFERSSLQSHGRMLVDYYHRLAWATNLADQHLASALGVHYRNANLRVSISSELMNRLVQSQPVRTTYINDKVLGNPTRGRSTTWTDVSFRLVPDAQRARLLLEARGRISSDTVTIASIVKLRSQADSRFLATKELEIGLAGLRSGPAWVDASTSPKLQSVETDVDFVPVLGLVVQSVAEAEYEGSQPKALLEARRKISQQVREEMDRSLAERIDAANAKFRSGALVPLENLDLSPELVEAQTTAQRVTLRIRLAGGEQLAGHNARPRAPGDSLASVQIHQSLLNNICGQLGWEGRTFTLLELREDVARRLNRELDVNAQPEHQGIQFTFARENAVRVRCRDGRVELSISLAQLKLHKESWRDFTVRVYYKPDLSSPEGRLQRDGSVQLIGDRLGPRAQLALRSIFSKAFAPSRSVTILPAALMQRPGLSDLCISQFDVEDEWIGLAVRADRPAVRQARK